MGAGCQSVPTHRGSAGYGCCYQSTIRQSPSHLHIPNFGVQRQVFLRHAQRQVHSVMVGAAKSPCYWTEHLHGLQVHLNNHTPNSPLLPRPLSTPRTHHKVLVLEVHAMVLEGLLQQRTHSIVEGLPATLLPLHLPDESRPSHEIERSLLVSTQLCVKAALSIHPFLHLVF